MKRRTIREIREAKGIKQYELAQKLSIAPGTVYNWERGRYEPTASMLRKVAETLGVSMDEIIFEPDQVKTVA